MAKDRFSTQADLYARYRPRYPQELFDHLLHYVPDKTNAWDCATGNGQAAVQLAAVFQRVEATDISAAQLSNAVLRANVHYQVSPAEHTPFPDNHFDLITVATAYHWFNWEAFRAEAIRVAKPGAVLAAWAYNLVQANSDAINRVLHWFYFEVVYTYWDKERRYVEQSYQTVAFNYATLPEKHFFIECNWTKNDLLGYVATWSSVENYRKQNGTSPLPMLEAELQKAWPGEETCRFRFPLFLKLGRIK